MSVKILFEIGHQASLVRVPNPPFTHNWELFVRGVDGNDISSYVEKVVFALHDSFPKPKRVIKEPPYCVKEAGYAAFEMPITIYFKGKAEDPKKVEFKYDLDLQPYKVQKEEYVFHNPSEDFRRRLLKGGAIALGGKDSSMSSKPSNNSEKKHKHKDEPKVNNTFKNLFGTPITKTSKVSPDPKAQQMQQQVPPQNKISPNSVKSSKTVSSSSSSSKEKSSEKHKSSKHHSPSRERTSEKQDSRRDDGSRHEKKKDKSHSKEKSSSKSKTKDKARSPSPKRPASPPPVVVVKQSKPVEPPPPPPVAPEKTTTSSSSSKKSSKKDKKSSDRDKKDVKSSGDKKSDHSKSTQKEKDIAMTNNSTSTKDVLKEKPKHDNKIEHSSNPATPVNDKRSEKNTGGGDSERKHKHKKKEKSKDHDREKELLPKEKKSSAKNAKVKEESNHTTTTPSPAKQQKRPESRKQQQQHNENTLLQPVVQQKMPRPPINHDTSDSEADSHVNSSSKADSDNSLDRRSIKREDSSPSPPPPLPVIIPETRPSKRDKPVKDEKKRKRRSKNDSSDHSPSPSSLMEPPQQKIRKEEIKNGDTFTANNTPNNFDTKSSFISPTDDRASNDYMTELKDLQRKIMTLQDNNDLQQVVEMIAATGQYEITSKTFDFDLCALEPGLIKRLQDFFGATSCS